MSFGWGSYYALSFRRGITHGWPAMVVLPLVVTAAVLVWDRSIRLRRDPGAAPARTGPVAALSVLGLLTHPTLDWMNTYGMRWWLPLDGSWSYGDALFIIDPWIWLALGGAVFLSSRPTRPAAIVWATVAVLTSTFVIVGVGLPVAVVWTLGLGTIVAMRLRRGESRLRAAGVTVTLAAVATYFLLLVAADGMERRQVLQVAEAGGLRVEDVMVAPRPGNPFASDVEVLTDEALVPGEHRWIGGPRVVLRREDDVPLLRGPDELSAEELEGIVRAAQAEPAARDFLVWSRYPHVRVTASGDGWSVHIADARYDDRPGAGALSGVTVWVPDPSRP